MELGNVYGKHRSIVYYSSVNKKTILISLASCAVTFEPSTVTVFNKVFWVVSRLKNFWCWTHRQPRKTSDVGHTDSLAKLLMLDTLTA